LFANTIDEDTSRPHPFPFALSGATVVFNDGGKDHITMLLIFVDSDGQQAAHGPSMRGAAGGPVLK